MPEQVWRSGRAIRPYFSDLKLLVENRSSIPKLSGKFSGLVKTQSGKQSSSAPVATNNAHNLAKPVVDISQLSFVHFPIEDCCITDDEKVLNLAQQLAKDILNGEVLYLHCWGGHGRTGTVVCLILHLLFNVRTLFPRCVAVCNQSVVVNCQGINASLSEGA